jgi:uncharacterized protein YgiM (DUF1202 family)
MRILNIFILSLVFLLLMPSVYAFDPTERGLGVILGTVVNVRSSPSLEAKIVTSVTEGEYVRILKWTDIEQEIGTFKDHWVEIQTSTYKKGFIFGAFIFELDQLYKRWGADTCCGLIFAIRFKGQGEFEFYEGCAEPECGSVELKNEGTFIIDGRRIELSGSLQSSNLKEIYDFYLFRWKGKNVLISEKLDIEEIPEIQKEMGGCWGWW